MKYTFNRETENDLIVVKVLVDGKFSFRMILDTGATHTTFDSNALYLKGCDMNESFNTVEMETANGRITAELFEIESLAFMTIKRKLFPVQVIDFHKHGMLSDYEGILGLDFFHNTDLNINFKDNIVSVIQLEP